MVYDPVCGMEIKDTIKAETKVYKGRAFYFCTTLCKIQFEQNPEKYIKKNNTEDEQKHNTN